LKTEYDGNLKALSAQQRSIGLFCSSVLKVIRSTKWHGGRLTHAVYSGDYEVTRADGSRIRTFSVTLSIFKQNEEKQTVLAKFSI